MGFQCSGYIGKSLKHVSENGELSIETVLDFKIVFFEVFKGKLQPNMKMLKELKLSSSYAAHLNQVYCFFETRPSNLSMKMIME